MGAGEKKIIARLPVEEEKTTTTKVISRIDISRVTGSHMKANSFEIIKVDLQGGFFIFYFFKEIS